MPPIPPPPAHHYACFENRTHNKLTASYARFVPRHPRPMYHISLPLSPDDGFPAAARSIPPDPPIPTAPSGPRPALPFGFFAI